MQSKRGFTLVELIVTIAIVAILTVLAAPSINNLIAKQQLNKSARELSSTLSQARSQAALLRTNITVNLNSTATDTTTTFNWKPSGKSIYGSTSITAIVFLPSGKIQTATNTTPDTSLKVCETPYTGAKGKIIVISFMGSISQTEGTC